MLVEEIISCADIDPIGDPEVEPNGGNNSDPVEYDPRNVGSEAAPTLITGTYWAADETRDMDWFNFTLTEPMIIYASVDVNCGDPSIWVGNEDMSITTFAGDNGEGEGEALVTGGLIPGNYWFIVAPYSSSADQLEHNYNASLWGEFLPQLDNSFLDSPEEIEVTNGEAIPEIFGSVFHGGLTDASGQGQGIDAQFGYGDVGLTLDEWTWVDAGYVGDTGDTDGDIYSYTIDPQCMPGSYDYSFRFRLEEDDLQGLWVYADLDGSANGFDFAQLGNLTITGYAPSPSNLVAGDGFESQVELAWMPACPGDNVYTEIAYDDGSRENGVAASSVGSGTAVRFIPLSYPVTVVGFRFFADPAFGRDSDGASLEDHYVEWNIHLWGGSHAGTPAEEFMAPIAMTPEAGDVGSFVDVDLTVPFDAASPTDFGAGDFFMGVTNGEDGFNWSSVDETSPVRGNSWFFFNDELGGSWTSFPEMGQIYPDYLGRDLMFRALVDYGDGRGIVELEPTTGHATDAVRSEMRIDRIQGLMEKGLIADPMVLSSDDGITMTARNRVENFWYDIYRATEPGIDYLTLPVFATTTNTNYVDLEVENDQTYFYLVSAEYEVQGVSAPTNEVSATPRDRTAPLVAIDNPLIPTTDTQGPYPVEASVDDNGLIDYNEVYLHYSIDQGETYNSILMTAIDVRDEAATFTADIPGQVVGTTVQYYVTAADIIGNTGFSFLYDFVIRWGMQLPYFSDFEEDNGNLNAFVNVGNNPDFPNGLWEWGRLGGSEYGPQVAPSGENVWGIGLANNYDHTSGDFGGYYNNARAVLETPFALDLRSSVDPILSFRHWYLIESSWDGGVILYSIDLGATWNVLPIDPTDEVSFGYPDDYIYALGTPGFTSDSEGWQDVEISLAPYIGNEFMFAFYFGSDGSVNQYPGWYFDDLSVYEPPPNLYGDLETAIGGGANFDPNDEATMFTDDNGDGIWTLTHTAQQYYDWQDQTPLGGYQILLVSGNVGSAIPVANPIRIAFESSEEVTFYLSKQYDTFWTPSVNYVWDSTMNPQADTWTIIGPWQGDNSASTETQAVHTGDGFFAYERTISQDDIDAGLVFRAARDNSLDFQIGTAGYTSDGSANNLAFSADPGDRVRFEIDANKGRIRATVIPFNLYGSVESELIGALDFSTDDMLTSFNTIGNGVHQLSVTTNENFDWGPGYQVVPNGNANFAYPTDGAIPILFGAGNDVTITFVSLGDGSDWIPEAHYAYDTVFGGMDKTFTLNGDWEARAEIPMDTQEEDGAYQATYFFETGGNFTYYVIATADDYEYQMGLYGLTQTATPITFSVEDNISVRFYADPITGRVRHAEGPFEDDVLINEFVTGEEGWIELYNTTPVIADLSNWTLDWGTGSFVFGDGVVINSGDYLLLDTDINLPTEGAFVALSDDRAEPMIIGFVAYGTSGPGPAPAGDLSCSRIPDGEITGNCAVDFNLVASTPDAENSGAAANLGGSTIVVNETFIADAPFIELYNNGDADVDLSGWMILANDIYTVPIEARETVAPGGFLTLQGEDYPVDMLNAAADNIYLFNADGERVFQMGWAAEPPEGNAMGLIPDGDLVLLGEFANEIPIPDGYQYVTPTPDAPNASSDVAPTISGVSDEFAELLVVTWTAPAVREGLVNYKIWRMEQDGAQYSVGAVLDANMTAFIDQNVTIGETYSYRVSAVYDDVEVRDTESNMSDVATGTVPSVHSSSTFVVDATQGTARNTNLLDALGAADVAYSSWNINQYGGFDMVNLTGFDLIIWDAGVNAIDISAYDAQIEAFLTDGGDMLQFAQNVTVVPSYYSHVSVSGFAPGDAAEQAVGTVVQDDYTSYVTRDLTLELDAAPAGLTLSGLAQYIYFTGGTTGNPLAVGGKFSVEEEGSVAEAIYLGFSSASVSGASLTDFQTFIDRALTLFADDIDPVVDTANIQPAAGAHVKGIMDVLFPVTDENLNQFYLQFEESDMTAITPAYRIMTSVTEPGDADEWGVSLYYDAEQGAMVATLNTLLETEEVPLSSRSSAPRPAELSLGLDNVKETDGLFSNAGSDKIESINQIRDLIWSDGAYAFSAQGIDAADNAGELYQAAFTVDNTLPTVATSFLAPTAAVIKPNETFVLPASDLNQDRLNVTVGNDYEFEAPVDAPVDNIWFDEGETIGVQDIAYNAIEEAWYFTSVNWNPDGDFDVTASIYDRAGNMASVSRTYTVDGTLPVIDAAGFVPADGSVIDDYVTVVWPANDTNMQGIQVVVTQDGADFETFSVTVDNAQSFSAYGITNFQYDTGAGAWTFDLDITVNDGFVWLGGSYEFAITVTDAAGNAVTADVEYEVVQPGLKVYFSPAADTLESAEPVEASIDVMIKFAANLFGYSMEFDFDNEYIEILDVVEGDFLTSSGNPTSFIRAFNNTNGSLSFASSLLGGVEGIDDDGLLATIHYRIFAEEEVSSQIIPNQDERNFFDENLDPLQAQFIASFTATFVPVSAPWWNKADFNHNNTVDGVDLIGISWAFGSVGSTETDPASPNWLLPQNIFSEDNADIASVQGGWFEDNKVNSTDLSWFALQYGEVGPDFPASQEEELSGIAVVSNLVAELSFNTDVEHIEPNDLIPMDLMIHGADNLFGVDLEITYDPTALEFVSLEQTELLKSDDQTTMLTQEKEGAIAMTISRLNGSIGGVQADGSVATVVFRAIGETESALKFNKATLINADFQMIQAGVSDYTLTVKELPKVMELSQNFPNPFNPSTVINFALPKTGQVTLMVYSVTGQLVRTLVNDTKDAGHHSVRWNGLNDHGEPTSSGVYFYMLSGDGESTTKRMMLLK
ncbi:MAG: hypothetical protein B6244_02615 [Candidatus Cloacimonetes bacterium 4572_55]|nr:MAG: hypothetical protein B6244_02615 [Candidatus Cloacimonetes bacterium 4572_55]